MHLGIDLGTSGLKLLVLRDDGVVVAEHEAPLTFDEPRPGWAEADPVRWLHEVMRALTTLRDDGRLDRVTGVGVTGQMHGAVLVNDEGRPVRPAVLWPDGRAREHASAWEGLGRPLRARLGGPFSPGLTGPVLGWLTQHEPAAIAAAHHALLAKDLVRSSLVGGGPARTDPTDASGTLLWDVRAGSWSEAALAAGGGIADELLPEVTPSDRIVGTWREAAVVTGAGDTPASLLALQRGVGGWRRGDLVINVGTGAQVIAPMSSPPDDSGPVDWHCYADPQGGHYEMVAMLNGGLALSWARERLGLDWPAFAAAARDEAPGAGGVRFRPFVTEERGAMRPVGAVGPGWDGPSGATSAQLARAAAEAQAFLVRRAADLVAPSAGRVWLVGGGARETWVQQLLADVLGRTLTRVEVRSAAALGAALLAAGPDASVAVTRSDIEPRDHPALHDAYAAWQAAYYGPATTD